MRITMTIALGASPDEPVEACAETGDIRVKFLAPSPDFAPLIRATAPV
jgi:hypothetical protein